MGKSIAEIDTNFRSLDLDGVPLDFRAATESPFATTGFPWLATEGTYCRLPQELIPQANDGVQELAWHTAGGMLRFRSDSSAVAVDVELRSGEDMSHMPRSGSAGFDLFEGTGSAAVFRANIQPDHGQTEICALFSRDMEPEMRNWSIYFPLYNGVRRLAVGLDPGCRIETPSPLAWEKPILFYGSSITQGGCASRPGNAYPAIVSRRLNANSVNWGFSGSGRGEPVMAEAIATVDMSLFVFDYDHNAPHPDHLEQTHEPFFRVIREARPDLPVIMVSRPDYYDTDDCRRRREIVRETCETARAAGDEGVHFVDGEGLFGTSERDLCTVDGCHPNDIGFLRMADALTPVVRAALG